MQVGYHIGNMQGLLNALDKAPKIVSRNMVLATKVAMKAVVANARAKHKFISRSGKLEASIKSRFVGTDATGYGEVYLDSRNTPYSVDQHEGTGLYGPSNDYIKIFPRNRSMLRWAVPGGFVFAKKVLFNPGIEGDPFLYNAAELSRPQINATFDRYTDKAIREAGL